MKRTRKILVCILTVLVLFMAILAWNHYKPSYDGPLASASWSVSGDRGVAEITVFGVDGSPVVGVGVETNSYSGWCGNVLTDATGKAELRPGELEVIGIGVNYVEVVNTDRFLFPPSLEQGLRLHVRLKQPIETTETEQGAPADAKRPRP